MKQDIKNLAALQIALLLKHKSYQDKWLKKNNLVNSEGYVFLMTRLDRVSLPCRSMCSNWLRKFLKRNNLPHFGVHGLRRMAASYSAGNNVPLTAIQAMLGHTEIATTNIYLRSLDKSRRDSTELMSKRFQNMIADNATTEDNTTK